MDLSLLQGPVILAPLILVVGFVYILGPALPLTRPWARICLFTCVWMTVARYLHWRLFDTVLPVAGSAVEQSWVWFSFLVEMLALGDAFILYLTFLRVTDHRSAADRHERKLRSADPLSLPSVDIYIATYNEPPEVIEKTIVGALSLEYPNFSVWVLDDGRRPWLKQLCTSKGVGYITRPDNRHAKAGNINHALKQTDGDFVAIFDADFIPQRTFLLRTMGFFEDPSVGIVQVPHAFYNHDPMQANLAMRKTLPDDQRFFFEAIMPSRDGWNAAFCCGSNSVTRRAALRSVGDALPTGSITEDMLLSLAMLQKGYVTRYLCERLAFGLAPESLKAFFIQRERWARGALQILYLRNGPLMGRMAFVHRLMFLPTHWLSQSLMFLMTLVAPLVFLWTGISPLVNVTVESIAHYLLPMVLAMVGGITVFAQKRYFPLAAQVLGTFQCFKLLPAIVQTIVRPHGLLFKVTPKGASVGGGSYESGIFWISVILMVATLGGLIINAFPEWRIVEQAALVPLVAFWAAINITVLFLVCMMCIPTPVRRAEERFSMRETVSIRGSTNVGLLGRMVDISMSGVGVEVDPERLKIIAVEQTVEIFISGVGSLMAKVARVQGSLVGLHFRLTPTIERDLLIRKIFTSGSDTTAVETNAWRATAALVESIWHVKSSARAELPTAMLVGSEEKLPAQTLVVLPIRSGVTLGLLADARTKVA